MAFYMTPADFKLTVSDFGMLSAIANIASMVEENPQLDGVAKEYMRHEAQRLLRAIEAAEEVEEEEYV